jgi:hypothetical protein
MGKIPGNLPLFPIIGTECPDYCPDKNILISSVALSLKSLASSSWTL